MPPYSAEGVSGVSFDILECLALAGVKNLLKPL